MKSLMMIKNENLILHYHSWDPYRGVARKEALHPSSLAYINLRSSNGRLTNHHSRTLHMVYPKISRAV